MIHVSCLNRITVQGSVSFQVGVTLLSMFSHYEVILTNTTVISLRVVKSLRGMSQENLKMLILINMPEKFCFQMSKFINNSRPLNWNGISQEEKESPVKDIQCSSSTGPPCPPSSGIGIECGES